MTQHKTDYKPITAAVVVKQARTNKAGKSKKSEPKHKSRGGKSKEDGDGGLSGVGLGTLSTKTVVVTRADFRRGVHHLSPWQYGDTLALANLKREELEGVHALLGKKSAEGSPQLQSSYRMLTRSLIDAKDMWEPASVQAYVSQAQV